MKENNVIRIVLDWWGETIKIIREDNSHVYAMTDDRLAYIYINVKELISME